MQCLSTAVAGVCLLAQLVLICTAARLPEPPSCQELSHQNPKPSILIGIVTGGTNMEKLVPARRAVASSLRGWPQVTAVIVARDADMDTQLGSEADNVYQLVLSEDAETGGFRALPKKVLNMFAAMRRQYVSCYDWFMKIDDDTFVNAPKLAANLAHFNPSVPACYGSMRYSFKLKADGPTSAFRELTGGSLAHGGAGYIFSRALMELMSAEDLEACIKRQPIISMEDAKVGACVYQLTGVRCHAMHTSFYGGFDPSRNAHNQSHLWRDLEALKSRGDVFLHSTTTVHSCSPDTIHQLSALFDQGRADDELKTKLDKVVLKAMESKARFLTGAWQCTVRADQGGNAIPAICSQGLHRQVPSLRLKQSELAKVPAPETLARGIESVTQPLLVIDVTQVQGSSAAFDLATGTIQRDLSQQRVTFHVIICLAHEDKHHAARMAAVLPDATILALPAEDNTIDEPPEFLSVLANLLGGSFARGRDTIVVSTPITLRATMQAAQTFHLPGVSFLHEPVDPATPDGPPCEPPEPPASDKKQYGHWKSQYRRPGLRGLRLLEWAMWGAPSSMRDLLRFSLVARQSPFKFSLPSSCPLGDIMKTLVLARSFPYSQVTLISTDYDRNLLAD